MNVRESNDLNDVLHFLLTGHIGSERAREAAARLADRSFDRLMCGLKGDEVREMWPATSPADARRALLRCEDLRDFWRSDVNDPGLDDRADELDQALRGDAS